ncbi:MAG: site-2 protease family protein [Gemmataceae bacterium]|nr:site-2 protease family protein [Gemmataceae bacterium]
MTPDPHPPRHHDIAEPGPVDPATGQPDHRAEVSALKDWLRQNAVSLALTAAAVVLVCVYLDVVDTVKVVVGLGFIIFIHELGHFLAAKWCDVHVKTFSIGFGPAVPFCSYKWGETTYMLGIIPLGGYVSMVGEGTGESTPDGDPDDDAEDPRSFKNKPVGSRMLIISAGVVMNVILGMGCFAAAYLHGVREEPAVAGTVASGSAAWRAGLRTGDEVTRIGSREHPTFKDLRPIVMSTGKGEQVPVVVSRDGKTLKFEVEPLREEGTYFPTLGITTGPKLTLVEGRKRSTARPAVPGSPAAAADPGFEGGDRIVAMSDPAAYPAVTPLPVVADPADPSRRNPDYDEYHRRMVLLADKPIAFHVLRKGDPDGAPPKTIAVQPVYRSDLGLRMGMGEVVAVRAGGPAARAGVTARNEDAAPPVRGDRVVQVAVTHPNGRRTWWVADGKRPEGSGMNDEVKSLDPVTLPIDLEKWAASFPDPAAAGRKVDLVVLREADNTSKRVPLVLDYDPSFRFDRETVPLPNSPVPVPGLGLAYWAEAVVNEVEPDSPAARAGLRPNDRVEAVRHKTLDDAGAVTAGDWDELKPHQWASAEAAFQSRPPHEIDLRVKRADGTTEEVTVRGREDRDRPAADRGLVFQPETRTVQAADLGDALALGARRTVRFIKEVYMNLYGYLRGRISTKTLSGPLSIANAAYKIAGEDFWQFLLFLGMISVNLAVVNFLPVPVLDGGHMVFLLIEKVIGRPVPERLFAAAMWAGLVLILLLFVFVITLDIRRVVFGWF